jgi:hypothetical protein
MKHLTKALLAPLCMMLVSACGGNPSGTTTHPSSSDTASSHPTTTTPPVATSSTAASDTTGMPLTGNLGLEKAGIPTATMKPRGANAAPGAPQSPNPIFDASQQAFDNFISWFVYETMEATDFPGKNGDTVYADGVAMCGQIRLNKNPRDLMSEASGLKGYSGTGAAALYKATINALCPWHNLGYQTYFDRNVVSMKTGVDRLISWNPQPPTIYEYGYLAREVCTYLKYYQTNGLEEHMLGLVNKDAAANLLAYTNNDQRFRKILVHQAVLGVCPGYTMNLGGYWTMH